MQIIQATALASALCQNIMMDMELRRVSGWCSFSPAIHADNTSSEADLLFPKATRSVSMCWPLVTEDVEMMEHCKRIESEIGYLGLGFGVMTEF